MTDKDYKPRIIFEITEEQQRRVNTLLSTYGIKKTVFQIILDDLLDLLEEHGLIVIGAILDGAAKPREIMPTLAKAERIAKNADR